MHTSIIIIIVTRLKNAIDHFSLEGTTDRSINQKITYCERLNK